MRSALHPLGAVLALASLCAAALLSLPAGRGAAAAPRCASFKSQADAQARFEQLGGSPRHRIPSLDPDGDGVACEQLGAPYVGFATISYNRSRGFFWGAVAMPRTGEGEGEFACLQGNPHFPDGPRLVKLMQERPGKDRQVFRSIGAEARKASGRLVWKASVELPGPGRYYAQFAERVRLHAYGPNECPAFRSRSIALPKPLPTGS